MIDNHTTAFKVLFHISVLINCVPESWSAAFFFVFPSLYFFSSITAVHQIQPVTCR